MVSWLWKMISINQMNWIWCVSQYLLDGEGNKKPFLNALVSGVINVLKTPARYFSLITFVTQDTTFQNEGTA